MKVVAGDLWSYSQLETLLHFIMSYVLGYPFFFPSKYSYRKDLHFLGEPEQFNISIYIWIHIQVSGFICQ